MSAMQKQINDLNYKVDQLHSIVQRLSQQISLLATDKYPIPSEQPSHPISKENERINGELIEPMISSKSLEDVSCPSVLDHKDILLEHEQGGNYRGSDYSEIVVSPEIQIRRLTAQLTAAYHRIAVLEEQLIKHRIHS